MPDGPQERTPLLPNSTVHQNQIHRLSSTPISFPSTSRRTSFPFNAPSRKAQQRDIEHGTNGNGDTSRGTVGGGDIVNTPDSIDDYYADENDYNFHFSHTSRAGPKRLMTTSEFSSSGLSDLSDSEDDGDGDGDGHGYGGEGGSGKLRQYHKHHHHRHLHNHHHRRHHGKGSGSGTGTGRRSWERSQDSTITRGGTYEFGLRHDGLPKFSRQCLWSEIKCYGSYILPPLLVFGVLAIGSGLIYVAIKRKWI